MEQWVKRDQHTQDVSLNFPILSQRLRRHTRLLRSFLWKYHSTSQKAETPEVDRYRLSWKSLLKYISLDQIREKIESKEIEKKYVSLDSLGKISIDVTKKYLDGSLQVQDDGRHYEDEE